MASSTAVGANKIGPASSPRSYLHVIPSPSDDNQSCSDRHPLLLDISAWTRATFIAQRQVVNCVKSAQLLRPNGHASVPTVQNDHPPPQKIAPKAHLSPHQYQIT